MDVLAVRNQDVLRIQVKSTKKSLDNYSYQWQVCKSKPKRSLSTDDCDIVACVALDIRKIAFFHVNHLREQLTRRILVGKMSDKDLEGTTWEKALAKMQKK